MLPALSYSPLSPPQGSVSLCRISISFPGKMQMPQMMGLSSRGHWGQGHTLASLIAFQCLGGPCSHWVGDTIPPALHWVLTVQPMGAEHVLPNPACDMRHGVLKVSGTWWEHPGRGSLLRHISGTV